MEGHRSITTTAPWPGLEPLAVADNPDPGDGAGAALVGASPGIRQLRQTLARIAPGDARILIEGESGTGKELVAAAVHEASDRAGGPFTVVDCGVIPPNLFESELFGHERGSFTGASSTRIGRLEEADGGTVFLDEIGELPLALQPKLLRALENGEIRRVGGSDHRRVNLRVVAATNRDLSAEVARGRFRQDLYYRIAVVKLRIPSLRERLEDLPVLVDHLVRQSLAGDPDRAERLLAELGPASWERLERHDWRGNVRELRNTIERAIALAPGGGRFELDPSDHAIGGGSGSAGPPLPIDLSRPYGELKSEWSRRFDQEYLTGQLDRHGGNISRAARASGLERMHFKRILGRSR